jgi:hypothetical protein
MTAQNPVEVLTLEQYQQAKKRGKNPRPGTLVLVPASLLDEMQAHQTHEKPEASDIVEMTYVGQHTQMYLRAVKLGQETLATLKRRRRTLGNGPGDAALTLDEAINILEREHSVHKTDADLKAEMLHYQQGLLNIEREPDAYVLPEIARDWYEQQIERVRQLLQAQAEDGDVA